MKSVCFAYCWRLSRHAPVSKQDGCRGRCISYNEITGYLFTHPIRRQNFGVSMSQDVASLPAPVSVLLEGLLLIADEGVVIADADGKIVYCNPSAERILGLPADRIIGTNSYHFEQVTILEDGSPFPADAHPVMRTLRTGMPCSKVVIGINRGPETSCRWLSISSAIIPVPAGESILAFAIFADITRHVDTWPHSFWSVADMARCSQFYRATKFLTGHSAHCAATFLA
jgi:PAS domain S-box-containing protein